MEQDFSNNLFWLDYGARQYDPTRGQFTTPDPLAEKYYGWNYYTYCVNNPMKYVDPDGKQPTGNEAALMAAYVYGDKNANAYLQELAKSHWNISNYNPGITLASNSVNDAGLQSVIFERKINGKTEYAYVFAGTSLKNTTDAQDDFLQLTGRSPQYHMAIFNARKLSKALGNNELTFVGHSMGGGESIASSMATGRLAITFNSAAVSDATIRNEKLNMKPRVINYRAVGVKIPLLNIRFGGDVLNNVQEKVGLKLPGIIIPVYTGIIPTHTINVFPKLILPNVKQ